MINMPTDPAWYAKMAEHEGDASIGAGVRAIPDMLVSMWARRHEISDKEWREAGPVLLGMALSGLDAPSDRATVLEEAARVAENPGFIEARDTEWDAGVNYAKRYIAAAIRQLSSPDEGVA